MSRMNLTLQNRITSLMLVSSILFICIFTFIQINNQLANLTRYNSYRANLSSLIIKNNLETAIKEAGAVDVSSYLQKSIPPLIESDLAKDITIFDLDGKIIAASLEKNIGDIVGFRDINKIEELKSASAENKWSALGIDNLNGKLYLYIALKSNGKETIAYIVKISLPIASVEEAFKEVYIPVILAIIFVILANIIFGFILSKAVIGPIKILNNVTKLIAGGDLSVKSDIKTNDELEELGNTFNYMADELIKMKERAENANPLTKLPGNIIIQEQVEKRIQENLKFMVIYCDLDNFKAFNDKYGIAKGDEAIRLTAEIFKEAAKIKGTADDFIGHEGGDDFILLTAIENAQGIAEYITSEFDKRIRTLYSVEDLKQNFITAHSRNGSVKNFPIMTISLAGVTNAHRPITSYGQVTNIAAEIKKKAKAIEGSVFVIDQRTDKLNNFPN